MSSFSKLLEAKKYLETIDNESARWLLSGINRCLLEGASLDDCLKIRGMRYRYLMQKRDNYLFEAWLCLNNNCSYWQKSSKLSEMIFRFETRTWPRVQHHVTPPNNLDSIQRLIFEAFRLGLKVPGTPRQLHNIILRNMNTVHIS